MIPDVVVWVVRPTAHVDPGCCSPREHADATSLRTSAARDRHLRSRAVLRHAVAATSGTAAGDVPLVAPPGQAPRLTGPDAPAVSLAHTAGTVAVAVAGSGPIGIDIEVVGVRSRPVPAVALHGERLAAVAGLVADELAPLAVWVLLEAALKAGGTGFGAPQQQVRFTGGAGAVGLDVPGHSRLRGVVHVLAENLVLAVATPLHAVGGGPALHERAGAR